MSEDGRVQDWMSRMRWDEQGLLPVIIVQEGSGEVLTLAYMNQEAFLHTLKSGEVWLYSRSRRALWHKGETSGNIQKVVGMRLDCDGDALVVSVEPQGPACHTGAWTCFHRPLPAHFFQQGASARSLSSAPSTADPLPGAVQEKPSVKKEEPFWAVEVGGSEAALGAVLEELYVRIEERRHELPDGSYTTYLFREGTDKILKKLGEEAVEVIIAASKNPSDQTDLLEEMADLLYHLLVLVSAKELKLEALAHVLRARLSMNRDRKYSRRPVEPLQPATGEKNTDDTNE